MRKSSWSRNSQKSNVLQFPLQSCRLSDAINFNETGLYQRDLLENLKKKHPSESHLFRVFLKKKNPNECFHKFATNWKRTPPLTKNPQKVSVFVVFLVRISPHSDWIRSDTEDICPFSPNAGKYGPAKLQIRTIFKQCDFRTFSHNISSETLWLQ